MTLRVPVSAQQQAANYLREQILSGKLVGGTRLKADRIAQELGVSRMPVREAILQLHAEGLVVVRPNRSAIVISLTPDDVIELFQIRAVLEGLAARLATPNLTNDAVEELYSLLARMERVDQEPDVWLRRHDDLHEYICELSRAPRLITQIRNIRASVLPYIRMYVNVYHEVEIQGAEHRMLLNVAERRNAELFEATMRDHIVSTAASIANFMRNQSSQGSARTKASGGLSARKMVEPDRQTDAPGADSS